VDAYKEAMKWASPTQVIPADDGEMVELPLLGIKEIMPIWEDFENGSELGYRDDEISRWKQLTDVLLTLDDVQDEQDKKSTD